MENRIARELLRTTNARQLTAAGARPYSELRTRSNSVSSGNRNRVLVRRSSDPNISSSVNQPSSSSNISVGSQVTTTIMASNDYKIDIKFIGKFREGVDAEQHCHKH